MALNLAFWYIELEKYASNTRMKYIEFTIEMWPRNMLYLEKNHNQTIEINIDTAPSEKIMHP